MDFRRNTHVVRSSRNGGTGASEKASLCIDWNAVHDTCPIHASRKKTVVPGTLPRHLMWCGDCSVPFGLY